jgi:cyclopropane fatty-acyl-phospholipid synthase-like methyltransferase
MTLQTTRKKVLAKHGLSDLRLVWPDDISYSREIDYINKNPNSIKRMYGESDLSKLPIFQGGFINFGYWPTSLTLANKNISKEERITCSKQLYELIGNFAEILPEHSLLEIGCGLGYGSTFLSTHYDPRLIVGLDISPEQIARAKKYQVSGIEAGKLRFSLGEAESMPFTDNSFDSIVSIEAAQHFSSIEAFSKEASRILKPGGKLVFTSFFPATQEGLKVLDTILPDYHIHGSKNTIAEVEKKLSAHMECVTVSSIGKNVWDGFSKWLDQIGYQNQWSKIWYHLYKKKLIDYVIYQAKAPGAKCYLRP